MFENTLEKKHKANFQETMYNSGLERYCWKKPGPDPDLEVKYWWVSLNSAFPEFPADFDSMVARKNQ